MSRNVARCVSADGFDRKVIFDLPKAAIYRYGFLLGLWEREVLRFAGLSRRGAIGAFLARFGIERRGAFEDADARSNGTTSVASDAAGGGGGDDAVDVGGDGAIGTFPARFALTT
jgi:hypothetical protein